MLLSFVWICHVFQTRSVLSVCFCGSGRLDKQDNKSNLWLQWEDFTAVWRLRVLTVKMGGFGRRVWCVCVAPRQVRVTPTCINELTVPFEVGLETSFRVLNLVCAFLCLPTRPSAFTHIQADAFHLSCSDLLAMTREETVHQKKLFTCFFLGCKQELRRWGVWLACVGWQDDASRENVKKFVFFLLC